MSLPQIAIIELGSQLTQVIERTLRELKYRSMILDPKRAAGVLQKNPVKTVILSGGPSSVYDKDAPQPPLEILSLRQPNGRPISILSICYGMQWVAQEFGGEVKAVDTHREYGPADIQLDRANRFSWFFDKTPFEQRVWMSHGDSVTRMPEGFKVLARTETGAIAAMTNGTIWCVQFHPEVPETEHGKVMLKNFLHHIAECSEDWTPSSLVSSIQEDTLSQLDNGRAIFGYSGGVDSTALAKTLAPVLGDNLLGVTIDGGQLREGEIEEIRLHARHAGIELRVIDAQAAFSEVMAGTIDAEEKRRRFKKIYAGLLIKAGREFGATHILQGTLAPDLIESGATGGNLIKSHHNVGNDWGGLIELKPIGHLFKYEVRALAREVGLPESVWNRQPFPGPGLFIRTIGISATPDNVAVTRWADARVREILQTYDVWKRISQTVVAYLGTNTVGVKGDKRVYAGVVVVRAVETIDFMTASGIHLDEEVEAEIVSVVTRHPQIVRVFFDPTPKPPATTELE